MQISKSRFLPLPGLLGFHTKTRCGCGLDKQILVVTSTTAFLCFSVRKSRFWQMSVWETTGRRGVKGGLNKNDAIAPFFRSWSLNCMILSSSFFCGAATQRGSWPPHSSGFYITYNDAPQSVGLLWTSDQLVAETSTWHTTFATDKHPCPRWDSNPRSQQASGRRPTP